MLRFDVIGASLVDEFGSRVGPEAPSENSVPTPQSAAHLNFRVQLAPSRRQLIELVTGERYYGDTNEDGKKGILPLGKLAATRRKP